MCFEYDGYNEFSDAWTRKARKAHRCEECREPISPGEEYRLCKGKFDGEFFTTKTCRRCCFDINRVVEHELSEGCHWGEAWPPSGELVDYLTDSGMGQTQPQDVPTTFKVGDEPKVPSLA